MKLNNRIALTLTLSAALCSVSLLAQGAGITTTPAAGPRAAPTSAPAPAPAPAKPAHVHKTGMKKVANEAKYSSCLKQKLAVAEYFCSIHPHSCQGEKDGAAQQCHSEARGERQKG